MLPLPGSSHTVYQGGIEIEIDTKEEHRCRWGLAQAAAARLIWRLDRGLHPAWDAHNKAYITGPGPSWDTIFDKEYEGMEICKQDTVDGCQLLYSKTLTIKLVCANLICGLERTNLGLCVQCHAKR